MFIHTESETGLDVTEGSEDCQSIYERDLVMNVRRGKQWGSFRHLPIEKGQYVFHTYYDHALRYTYREMHIYRERHIY